MPSRNPCFGAVLLMLLILDVSGCSGKAAGKGSNKEPTRLSFLLDWRNSVQFLGYYAAGSLGYYKDEGLEVVLKEISDPHEIPALPYKVESGEFDLGTASTALTLAQSKGAAIVSVASIYQYGPHVLFAKKGRGINTIRDFKGRTIADMGASWHAMIEEVLELGGMSTRDAKLVPESFDMAPFYDDTVDIWSGYLINEVPQARLKGYELVTFPLYEYGIINLGGIIYTGRAYMQAHGDRIVKFIRASVKCWEWAVKNPSKAVDMFREMFPGGAGNRDFLLASFNASIPLIKPSGRNIGFLDVNEYDALLKRNYHADKGGYCTDEYLNKAHETK